MDYPSVPSSFEEKCKYDSWCEAIEMGMNVLIRREALDLIPWQTWMELVLNAYVFKDKKVEAVQKR